MTYHIGCVVMAAGNAERFAANKLAAQFEGKSLISRALDAVPKEADTVVVTQYPDIEILAKAHGFKTVRNEHPDWGISHTISLGIETLKDCDAILFMVSDQPLLKASSVQAVIDRWKKEPDCIVGLSHNGKRGNPNIFPKEFYGELLELREDHGGNTVIRRHEDRLRLVEAQKPELTDVDTRTALRDLENQTT